LAGDLDPEVEELLGIDEQQENDQPDFAALFSEDRTADTPDIVDTSKKSFPKVTQFEQKPKPYFNDKDYYKKALANLGDSAKRLHGLLSQFLGAKDPQDRSLYRGRLVPAYWDVASQIAQRVKANLPPPKRFLLRFGVLSPTFISAEQRTMLCKVVFENKTGEPILYLDEWVSEIADGRIAPSETDEVKIVKKDSAQHKLDVLEKRRGQRDAELSLLRNKISELSAMELKIIDNMKTVMAHGKREEFGGLNDVYSSEQRSSLGEIPDLVRRLLALDKEIGRSYNTVESVGTEIEDLSSKVDGAESSTVGADTIRDEFNTTRQMAKLCVGRQGNHFPVMMKQYVRNSIRDICTRENVLKELADVEALDSGLFLRTFKGQTNRVVPYIILIPCYGDQGICWTPFDRRNRAASRGRLAIPLYPKNPREAILAAVADLRWQVAKEKAQHYWMEEGITGRYYQWFQEQKMKGDVKDSFIRDYILWITWESQGTQKLDREVRGVFWRMMPFPQEIKENLKNRGFVYNELYKKDANIARSVGY